jgi:hypothetical protein
MKFQISNFRFQTTGVVALLAQLLCGCGYQQYGSLANAGNYPWHTLYRDDVKTVAVPIFTNRTYWRGVEFSLSKAIVNDLEAQTPYKVAPRDEADTVLEGEIANVRVRTLSNSPYTGVPQEQLYFVSVNFTWKDLRSGKILVQRHEFEQTAPFYPTLGEGRYVGDQLNIEQLAVAIVNELQADWGNAH